MSHSPIPADRLCDVGKAIIEALSLNRQKTSPETKHYLFGLWTRAAERNRDNPVFYKEALAKAEKFASN